MGAGFSRDEVSRDAWCIEVYDDASGMRAARRLRPWVGGRLALAIGVLLAMLRFWLAPRRALAATFGELLRRMGRGVASTTGMAALALDAERARRAVEVVSPLAVLPRSRAARGVYELCRALEDLARERPAESFQRFGELLTQYRDPLRYRRLSAAARAQAVAAATLARGALSVLRADGGTLQDDARTLETCGLSSYAELAPWLRHAYHSLRGEQALAAQQRRQLARKADERGPPWQAELWLTVVSLPTALMVDDLKEATQLAHRLEAMSPFASCPSLPATVAALALCLARDDPRERDLSEAVDALEAHAPRAFPGQTALIALVARAHNRQGRYAQAWALCERAQRHVTDADRYYVSLFLPLALAAADADAGLGRVPVALMQLETLVRRFAPLEHPLALGLLHEAHARIAHAAGMQRAYEDSLSEMEAQFRRTGSPALIARIARLAALEGQVR